MGTRHTLMWITFFTKVSPVARCFTRKTDRAWPPRQADRRPSVVSPPAPHRHAAASGHAAGCRRAGTLRPRPRPAAPAAAAAPAPLWPTRTRANRGAAGRRPLRATIGAHRATPHPYRPRPPQPPRGAHLVRMKCDRVDLAEVAFGELAAAQQLQLVLLKQLQHRPFPVVRRQRLDALLDRRDQIGRAEHKPRWPLLRLAQNTGAQAVRAPSALSTGRVCGRGGRGHPYRRCRSTPPPGHWEPLPPARPAAHMA